MPLIWLNRFCRSGSKSSKRIFGERASLAGRLLDSFAESSILPLFRKIPAIFRV